MKRLMVMGAAVEQLPGIIKAKEMGYEVGVIDYNPNAVGIPYADRYFNVSTIDPEGVCAAGMAFGADGFLTLATDLPMRAVAYANERMGLPGISQRTALLATDKGEMIKALKKNHVASPWYYIAESEEALPEIEKKLVFPCIMKPVDNAASRGVILLQSVDDLKSAYEYSREQSHCGSVILEEYMTGPEVSVEILVYQGTPHVLAVTDKLTTGAPHFVECGHNQFSMLPEPVLAQIHQLAIDAVKALGIHTGPAHVEIMATKDGPKIIELGARLGGDCITSHLVRLSTGVDMVKETITTLCGGEPDLEVKYKKGAAIRFLVSEERGRLQYVEGLREAEQSKGVVEVSMIMNSGDIISGDIGSSDDRIAYVITQDDDPLLAIADAEEALNKMSVVKE